jgi:hypothetical protein
MTLLHGRPSRIALLFAGAAVVLGLTWSTAAADTVVTRDGARLTGRVVSVDAASVVFESATGSRTIARDQVASISFGGPKPLSVAIKNVRSDDAVDVLLEGEEVLHGAREGGEWIDLTPRLKSGNNALRLRIHNDRGVWAYRLLLRLNDQTVPIECGSPQVTGKGCGCCGKKGNEIGVIDDLPEIWLHVDTALGRAEVLP